MKYYSAGCLLNPRILKLHIDRIKNITVAVAEVGKLLRPSHHALPLARKKINICQLRRLFQTQNYTSVFYWPLLNSNECNSKHHKTYLAVPKFDPVNENKLVN